MQVEFNLRVPHLKYLEIRECATHICQRACKATATRAKTVRCSVIARPLTSVRSKCFAHLGTVFSAMLWAATSRPLRNASFRWWLRQYTRQHTRLFGMFSSSAPSKGTRCVILGMCYPLTMTEKVLYQVHQIQFKEFICYSKSSALLEVAISLHNNDNNKGQSFSTVLCVDRIKDARLFLVECTEHLVSTPHAVTGTILVFRGLLLLS